MPYIKKEQRKELEKLINEIDFDTLSVGHLNFFITSIFKKVLKTNGINYQNINSLIGVLECCKLELYRRIASTYEDKKIKENGDI